MFLLCTIDCAGTASIALLANGFSVALSGRMQAGTDQLDYGAMVGSNVSDALLCVRPTQAAKRVQVVAAAADQALRPQSAKPDACRCGAGGAAPAGGCTAAGGIVQAWQLQLQPGQNLFNVTAAGGQRHALAVVRLAERSHAELRALTVKGLDGTTTMLCGPPALAKGSGDSAPAVMSTKSATTSKAAQNLGGAAAAPAPEDEVVAAQLLNRLSWKACQPGAVGGDDVPLRCGGADLSAAAALALPHFFPPSALSCHRYGHVCGAALLRHCVGGA